MDKLELFINTKAVIEATNAALQTMYDALNKG